MSMMKTLQSQIRWCARIQWTMAVVVCAMALAFYLLLYRPQVKQLGELSAQIRTAERDLKAGKTETQILPNVANEVETLRARLERGKKSIPPQQELPQFIRDVTQLSEQAMLRRFSFKPGVPSRGELVYELPIQFSFEGDFVSVYAFLRNTEDMPRLSRVRGMSIKGKDRNGHVTVSLAMNIYFSTE
jgi:Tfp pilus assembly protein PilO